MPNRPGRNKKSGSQIRQRAARPGSQPRSLAELLARSRAPAARPPPAQPIEWIDFIRASLPAELGPKVSRADYVDGELIVFTESAVWSARLRFALAEADEEIRRQRPKLRKVAIRVAPPQRAQRPRP